VEDTRAGRISLADEPVQLSAEACDLLEKHVIRPEIFAFELVDSLVTVDRDQGKECAVNGKALPSRSTLVAHSAHVAAWHFACGPSPRT